jgi:hypothetical protein
MNSGTPISRATPATERVYAGVSGWPIESEWVFSTVISAVIGS